MNGSGVSGFGRLAYICILSTLSRAQYLIIMKESEFAQLRAASGQYIALIDQKSR